MVAFHSSRRTACGPVLDADASWSIALARSGESPLDSLAMAGTRRSSQATVVERDSRGNISRLRIGRWRELSSTPQRRLAEVRPLADRRVAVRIERYTDASAGPSCDVWQLYSEDGRLEAALQTAPDGRIALMTDYRTRQACRLVRNDRGEYEKAEAWRL